MGGHALKVSVLTPTIPGREDLLHECNRSVHSHTGVRMEHLVHLDADHRGFAATLNHLARKAVAPWLLPLCDDDLLLPGALPALIDVAKRNEDAIVYSRPLVWGEDEAQFVNQKPPSIPVTALIPYAVWEQLGGWDERLREREDLDLWQRAVARQIPFVHVDDRPTWVYRLGHGGNKSRNGGIAS